MRLRSLVAGAMLVIGACGTLDPDPTAAGQYVLVGCRDVGGGSPGCPETDSAGTVVTVVDGQLLIGAPVNPDGMYDMHLTLRYEDLNGTSEQVASLFSSGTYSADETTLVLVDDFGGPAPITGTIDGSKITLLVGGRQYEFGRLVLLPPGRQ